MKYALFEAHASLVEDFEHPSLTRVKFVLADDKPNVNGQGIEYEDFADLAKTAINMPIKMRFAKTGAKAGAQGHQGSINLGHITNVNENTTEDGTHQLLADGVLYTDEYPSEIDYLKTSFASGTAPGLSWEIGYEKSVIKNGINWLKGVLTRAATFVRNPAYGKRTALLALASQDISEEEFNQGLIALASEFAPNTELQGGNKVTEEEIKKLKDDLEAATKAAKEATDKLATAEATVTSQADVIAGYKKAVLVTERTQKLTDAGFPLPTEAADLEKKQEFLAALAEETFVEYLADLAAMKKAAPAAPKKEAVASAGVMSLPRPSVEALPATDGLRERMRALRTQ